MLKYIVTPFGLLETYDYILFLGIIISIYIQGWLIMTIMKKKVFLFFLAGYAMILYVGQYAAAFIRCINDGALDGKMNLWKSVIDLSGSHFLGHVILYSLIYYPVIWVISTLFMEPDKKHIFQFFNISSIGIVVQHFFNRLGCLLRGCCYGIEYHGVFAIKFPYNKDIGHEVFPSQILEMSCMIIILIILLIRLKKKKDTFGEMIVGFGLTFFLSEFFLENPYAVKHFKLTYIQFICIPEIIIGMIYCYKMRAQCVNGETDYE